MKRINNDNMQQLQDWCKSQDLIYVQWYPYRMCSGYCIVNPSEEALEKFYENVRASDPKHESFVLKLYTIETLSAMNMMTIDEYIKASGCLHLFET